MQTTTVHLILDRPNLYMLWGIKSVYSTLRELPKSMRPRLRHLEAIIKIHLPSYYTGTVLVHTTRRICNVAPSCHEQVIYNALASFACCSVC
jgi:hypothetical protein